MKIVQKAYRVWIHSHLNEYPMFGRIDELDVVYGNKPSEAKNKCDIDGKNKHGNPAKYIDINCRRAKDRDKIEYNGKIIQRFQYGELLKQEERNKKLLTLDDNELYYVQDARSYVGNSILFWGLGSSGYVTDISRAQKYTKQEIIRKFTNGRETDIIWNAKHIESIVKMHVDSQYLKREFAI